MKRAILIASAVIAFASVCYLAILKSTWNSAQESSSTASFRSLPPGASRTVEFDWSAATLRHFTERERRDQAIDWTLLSVLSQSGLDTRAVEKVTFDLPPVRAGYLGPIANFEYGHWRSRNLGDGKVLTLIPQQESKDRERTLTQIADEARKNTGNIPKRMLVFEYRLNPDYENARVTRLPDIDATTFFREESGYHQAKIATDADLKGFLESVNDLSYVGVDDGQLVLGGRSTGAKPEDVSVDDVAALWQSAAFLKKAKDQLAAFNSKWESARYHTEEEKKELDLQYQTEKAELEASIPVERRVESSGFSLDPSFDFEGLRQSLEANRELIQRESGASDAELDKIDAGLRRQKSDAFYDFLDHLNQNHKAEFAASINSATRKYRLQSARYDGSLNGTRVGMTLFYTDLLAKLKAIDFWQQTPVEDFKSLTRVHLSRVFDADLNEHSATRLWFGTLDRGFQQADSTLLFAHNATRIYAASANEYTPGKEVEPNAESAQFLGWWNNHYEEVARLEPQYERLNQIMKWSVAIQFLEKRGAFDRLNFLTGVNVDRSNWFPDWVTKNSQLKFSDWKRVQFYPRGYKGTKTETLPLLKSAWYRSRGTDFVLQGGVSLANDEILNRALIPKSLGSSEETLLRSDLNYTSLGAGKVDTLETLEKTRYEFRDSSIVSNARDAAKFRSTESELKNVAVEREFEQSGNQMSIEVKIGDNLAERLSTSTSNDVIRVRFEELELDTARDIAEDVSSAIASRQPPLAAIGSRSDVQSVLALDCDTCYAIKLRGSNRWVRLAPERAPQVDLAPGLDARVAAMQDNAPVLTIHMLPDPELMTEVRSARYIAFDRSASEDPGAVMRITNKGPPAGSKPVSLHVGNQPVDGLRAPDGSLYLASERLPESIRSAQGLWDEVSQAGGTESETGLLQLVGNDRPDQLLDQIVKDPAAAKGRINGLVGRARTQAEDALRQGDDAAAKRQLDAVAYLQGRSPDLTARMAISDLRYRPEFAVREIQEALRSPNVMQSDIFDTINARLGIRDLTDGDRLNLERVAAMFDMRQMLRTSQAGDTIIPELRQGGRIDFHVRLAEPLKGMPVQAQAPVIGDGPWYVLDNPSLANLDPVIVARTAIDPTMARNLGNTVQLPRWDIGHFSPRMIETADGQHWVRLGEVPARASNMYHPSPSSKCSGAPQDDSCQQYPYMVEVKSAG